MFLVCLGTMVLSETRGELLYKNIDSLYPKAVKFWRIDSDSVSIYVRELYKRAKISGNPNIYLQAYHMKALTALKEESELYTDSLYALALSTKNPKYLATSYFLRGRNAYDFGEYKKSLNNYLLCQNILDRDLDSLHLKTLVKDNIGLIRILIGDNQGAIEIFEELLQYYVNDGNDANYLETLFSLAVAHHQNGNFQKSQEFVNKGMELAKGVENGPMPYFLSILGANQYGLGEHSKALVNLKRANIFFEDNEDAMRQAIAHYYMGMSYDALDLKDSSLIEMQRVDALYRKHPNSLYPLTRGAWERLLDEARRKGDTQGELRHITTLLTIDSIVSSNFRYINQNLVKRYDMPKLMAERRDLESGYQRRNKLLMYGLITFAILSFMVFRVWKFKTFAKSKDQDSKDVNSTIKTLQNPKVKLTKDRVDQISDGLAHLETEKFYLKPNITLKEVADILGTNNKYISLYLNRHAGSSYSTYINGLRIDHFIHKLATDPNFVKKYTLDAMAQQCGYTSNKALNKACKRLLGMTSSELLQKHTAPDS
jgi:tetratricopeptide (TPR) repeat protein/AraC-like DNA-binding protein